MHKHEGHYQLPPSLCMSKNSATVYGLPSHSRVSASISLILFLWQVSRYVCIIAKFWAAVSDSNWPDTCRGLSLSFSVCWTVVIPKVHHTTTAQSAGFQGLGGGALNKLFAKCINFALLATIIPKNILSRRGEESPCRVCILPRLFRDNISM